jgi:uncharacterized protein YggE
MLRRLLFALSCIASVGAPAAASAQSAPTSLPVVVAEGQATVKRAPDRAWISIAIETRDVRSAEARRKNAESMTTVQDVLKNAGITGTAVRTTGFSISPEMDYRDGRGILRGYLVRNQIEVRVDSLDRLPDVLDALNSPRGVALSVMGPRFDLTDDTAVQQEALRLAVQSAMSRAQAMAAGAKRQLGSIVRIEEPTSSISVPQPMVAMRMAAGQAEAQTPISPGEIEVHARVTVTVELK